MRVELQQKPQASTAKKHQGYINRLRKWYETICFPKLHRNFKLCFLIFFVSSGSRIVSHQLEPPKLMDSKQSPAVLAQPCCFILMYALILALTLSLVLDLKKYRQFQKTVFGPKTLIVQSSKQMQEKTHLHNNGFGDISFWYILWGILCDYRPLRMSTASVFTALYMQLVASLEWAIGFCSLLIGHPWLLCTRPKAPLGFQLLPIDLS